MTPTDSYRRLQLLMITYRYLWSPKFRYSHPHTPAASYRPPQIPTVTIHSYRHPNSLQKPIKSFRHLHDPSHTPTDICRLVQSFTDTHRHPQTPASINRYLEHLKNAYSHLCSPIISTVTYSDLQVPTSPTDT